MQIISRTDKAPRMSHHLDIDLRIKRDDLLGVPGGGNKVRKNIRIVQKAGTLGCNALVTTGGVQSNHARTVALSAVQRGWRCKLILHGTPDQLDAPNGNLLLMRLCGAEIEFVTPEEISSAMQRAMSELKRDGYVPYEIPGGGHCIEGALAYVDAVHELQVQCSKDQWQPEWIVLASGTGTTQAGIQVGAEAMGWKTNVLGVSVARKNPRGTKIVEESCLELRRHLNLNTYNPLFIDFRDGWVGDGYEKAGPGVFRAIRLAAKLEGLVLDPTYTGKAFSALLELRASGEIEKGSRVLFWHTGGILNLMSSVYIGDILKL